MSNNLKRFRLAAGMTQEELAEEVGTSSQEISRLERGDRKLTAEWLTRLGPPLGIAGSELLDDALMPVATSEQSPNLAKTPSEIELLLLYRALVPRDKRLVLRLIRRGFGEGGRETDDIRRKRSRAT